MRAAIAAGVLAIALILVVFGRHRDTSGTTVAPDHVRVIAAPLVPRPATSQTVPEPAATPAAAPPARPDSGRDDATVGLFPSSDEDPTTLHARLRREPRDAAWADRAEANLRADFADVPHIGGIGQPLDVRCGSTVCEVAGATPAGLPLDQVNETWEVLQGQKMADRLANRGLAFKGGSFGGRNGAATFAILATRR